MNRFLPLALLVTACNGASDDTGTTDDTGPRPVLDCSDQTTAYEGLPYCLTTIGLTEVKLFVPEDSDPGAPMASNLSDAVSFTIQP